MQCKLRISLFRSLPSLLLSTCINCFCVIYLPPSAVISQTVRWLRSEGLLIITTRCCPITPLGGQVTTAVSAEPTAPSIRPHSLKSDEVGFIELGATSFTPTATLFKNRPENKQPHMNYNQCCDIVELSISNRWQRVDPDRRNNNNLCRKSVSQSYLTCM